MKFMFKHNLFKPKLLKDVTLSFKIDNIQVTG